VTALSTVVAVVIAFATLRWTPTGRGTAVVHRVHSGHIGDYVAWLLPGIGTVAPVG
jgi:hypothetical protein